MGFKDIEQRRAYDRDLKRQRRAEKSGKAEVLPPASEVKVARALTPPLSPKESAESPSALAIKEVEEEEMKSNRIDGQVHLLSGSLGMFRDPASVFTMSKRLLESQGWCVWRYPTLHNETFVILRDHMVHGYPVDIPILTMNPERSLEVELKMNIPGCLN